MYGGARGPALLTTIETTETDVERMKRMPSSSWSKGTDGAALTDRT